MSDEHGLQQRHLEFIEFYKRANFNISKAIKNMGISRRSIYNWIEKYPEFKEAMWEAKEQEKDFYEDQARVLARGVPKLRADEEGNQVFDGWKERPDTAVVIFYLKTQAKDRGYIEGPDRKEDTPDSGLNLELLTKEEREKLFELIDKATVRPDKNKIDDAEIVDE